MLRLPFSFSLRRPARTTRYRLGPATLAVLIALAPARAAHPTAVALLAPVDLGGSAQSTVVWDELSSINGTLAPVSGAGSIAVHSPGFKGSAGFYSFSADYSATVASATVAFPVRNVTLQIVGMTVSGETAEGDEVDYTPEDHLTFAGGPVLTYTHAEGTGALAATHRGTLGGPVSGSGGGFDGDYHTFTWQWDLSALPLTVTSVSIHVPLRVHSSTIGARLDLGDAFSQLVGDPALSVFEQWRQTHFGPAATDAGEAADAADPDADGLPNLLEYALGADPLAPSPPALPTLQLSALGPQPSRLRLTFNRVADPALTYTVEAADTLGTSATWTPIWTSTGAENTAGAVTVEDVQTLATSPTRFLRLRVGHVAP